MADDMPLSPKEFGHLFKGFLEQAVEGRDPATPGIRGISNEVSSSTAHPAPARRSRRCISPPNYERTK
jgi:hypothetical protein